MSATAGRGAERRMEERARAAEKAWREEEAFSGAGAGAEAEQRIEEDLAGFAAMGDLNLGCNRDLERLVGIVRDIVRDFGAESLLGCRDLGWKWRIEAAEEEDLGKECGGNGFRFDWCVENGEEGFG